MNSDIVDYQRSKPYYPMHYDRNMQFMKDRSFWLVSQIRFLNHSNLELQF
jgi:hypothetical protein